MKWILREFLPTELDGLPLPPANWNPGSAQMAANQTRYEQPYGLIENELFPLATLDVPNLHLLYRGSRRWLVRHLIRTLGAEIKAGLLAYPETLSGTDRRRRPMPARGSDSKEQEERSIRRHARIDPLLKKKGWSPWQWAQATANLVDGVACQVSSSAAYAYIDGSTKKLDESTRNRLAAALGIPPNHLLL
jgi:hypothetical protein